MAEFPYANKGTRSYLTKSNFNTFTLVDVFRVREIKHSLMICQHNISAIEWQVGSLVTIPLKHAICVRQN